MFERYTETARRTLFSARHEATELGDMAIEPEHLLLGLLRADEGPTPQLFVRARLSYTDAHAQIRTHRGVHERISTSVEMPFSAETRRIILYTVEEADRLGQRQIGTGHVLLGVLREESSFAAGILRSHGMTVEGLR